MKEISENIGISPTDINIEGLSRAVHRGTDSTLKMSSGPMKFFFSEARHNSRISEEQKLYLRQLCEVIAKNKELGKLTLSQFRGRLFKENGLPQAYEEVDIEILKKILVPPSPR